MSGGGLRKQQRTVFWVPRSLPRVKPRQWGPPGHRVCWYTAPHVLCTGTFVDRGAAPARRPLCRVSCVSAVHGGDSRAPRLRTNRYPRRPCPDSGENLSYRARALLCASPVQRCRTPRPHLHSRPFRRGDEAQRGDSCRLCSHSSYPEEPSPSVWLQGTRWEGHTAGGTRFRADRVAGATSWGASGPATSRRVFIPPPHSPAFLLSSEMPPSLSRKRPTSPWCPCCVPGPVLREELMPSATRGVMAGSVSPLPGGVGVGGSRRGPPRLCLTPQKTEQTCAPEAACQNQAEPARVGTLTPGSAEKARPSSGGQNPGHCPVPSWGGGTRARAKRCRTGRPDPPCCAREPASVSH